MDNIPEPYINIMVTYKKEIGYGPYRERKVIETVTKRGFYCGDGVRIDGSHYDIAIPPDWQNFTFSDGTIALLPHGWGGDRLTMAQVINWKYDVPVPDQLQH